MQQFGRERIAENGIDVLQMLAKQPIEQVLLGAVMAVAEPPEPIAPFGDGQLAAGSGQLIGCFVPLGLGGHQVLARFVDTDPRPDCTRDARSRCRSCAESNCRRTDVPILSVGRMAIADSRRSASA